MNQETYESLKRLIAKINASDSIYEALVSKNVINVQNWVDKVAKEYEEETPKNCLYCDDKRPSAHFICDRCGVGMCDDCYDGMAEHDNHYHEICENADEEEYEAIVKDIGHEPAYLCENCLNEILGKGLTNKKI